MLMKKGQWITKVDWLFLLFALLFIVYVIMMHSAIMLVYGLIGLILAHIVFDIAYQRGRASFEKELNAKSFRES